jgi:hypothetical protein
MGREEVVPVRVDFAGGWLDVPALSVDHGYVVNCTITPMMSKFRNNYRVGGGVGGSAAWALLNGKNPIETELAAGVGWQDPAVILETGLCVWFSGAEPELVMKTPGRMLNGRMALEWSGRPHVTKDLVSVDRNYSLIIQAGRVAADAVRRDSYTHLCRAVDLSYSAQLDEGMRRLVHLPEQSACKYCGAGWGGYILRMFYTTAGRDAAVAASENIIAIEPYLRPLNDLYMCAVRPPVRQEGA